MGYGGKFTEIIPHLTVANKSTELSVIAEAELLGIMKNLGPIRAVCKVVELCQLPHPEGLGLVARSPGFIGFRASVPA